MIEAIDYAVANRTALGIRVINLSVGAGVYESYDTDPLAQATKRAVDAGRVVRRCRLPRAEIAQIRRRATPDLGHRSQGTVARSDDAVAAFARAGQ